MENKVSYSVAKIQAFFKKNKDLLVLSLFIIVVGILMMIPRKSDKVKNDTVKVNYESYFNFSKVPSGIVIWAHGVPESRKEFLHADSSLRYEFFDIGIFSADKVIYRVRVPFYTIQMFKLGNKINNFKDKRNPMYKKNVYPYNSKIN